MRAISAIQKLNCFEGDRAAKKQNKGNFFPAESQWIKSTLEEKDPSLRLRGRPLSTTLCRGLWQQLRSVVIDRNPLIDKDVVAWFQVLASKSDTQHAGCKTCFELRFGTRLVNVIGLGWISTARIPSLRIRH